MIEAYAFLAVFTVQILAMSVLYPARFRKHVREQATGFAAERLARLYPGVDLNLATDRVLTRFRMVNTGIALLGSLLLGWLFVYMRRPDWDEGHVIPLISTYFMIQMLPILFITWLGYKFNKAHKRSLLEAKRKANLQRRELFDYISPFIVLFAVASYFLFVVFVTYFQAKPFPGFFLIGVLTLAYALQAFHVYRALYGKKANPLENEARRVHTIATTVKVCIYSCIVCVAFFSFAFTLDVLDLKRWMPLAESVCFLITTLLCLMGLTAPPREPEVDELGSSRVS